MIPAVVSLLVENAFRTAVWLQRMKTAVWTIGNVAPRGFVTGPPSIGYSSRLTLNT